MVKKMLALVISLVLIILIVPFGMLTANAATTKTLDQAIAWLDSLVGSKVGSGQCVALIKEYYEFLGAPTPSGHAYQYATNSLPSGWQRIKGATPQPGDILVWTDGLEGYGHVAICGYDGEYYHQNWSGYYVQILTKSYTNGFSVSNGAYYANYWGVIRPDFKNSSSSTVTYTDITPGVYYIKNPASDGYLNLEYGKDENAANIHILEFGDYYSQMFEITESTTTAGYKIRPIPSSSRYVNVYAEMSSLASGKNVCIYDDTGDGTQRWLFEECSDGYIIHCVGNKNLVLDAPTWDVCVSTYTGADTQIWELIPVTHTVSYDANGGSGAPSSQTKVYGSNLTISSTIPTRDGYSFLGWSTSSEATSVDYKPGDSYSSDDNITLYAVWELRPSLVVNSSNNAVISTGGEIAYYTFTPSTTGDYVIYSTGDEDTRIYLYTNGEQIDTDDDSGDDYNFYLECTLTAGVEYTFAIKYYNSSVTGTISFLFEKTRVLTGINVSGLVDKSIYYVGEALDTSGLDVELLYSDGTTETITSGFTVSGFDSSTTGRKKFTVNYNGFSDEYISTVLVVMKSEFTYYIQDDEAIIYEYDGSGGHVTIPETLGGYPVTKIDEFAFLGCNSLISIDTANVTYIGYASFHNCESLISISMPNVTFITYNAFYGCTSLKRVYIPNLDYLTIDVFKDSSSVMFYAPLNSVAHNYAVENSIPYFEADDFGYQDDYTYYVSNSKATIVDYNGDGGDITIPTTLGGYIVKNIGTKAFYGCESLTSVTMPSITTVGTSAFRNCTSLTTVTMPNVTTLAHQVFQGCSSLVSVEMPRIAEIGDYVFKSCNSELTIYAPDNEYAKQYAEDNNIKLDGAEKIKAVSYKVSGDKVVFTVTTLPVYNRIKVSFADNLSTYITYKNDYIVNSDGNYVFTVSVPAIVGTTEYAFDGRLVTTNKYSKEYCYSTVEVEQDETPTFISVTHTIDDDKIIFTVVTKSGDFNRIKVTTADNLGGSLGVASSYSVNADGNHVWIVKAAAPTATTTYAFDLRSSETMKYIKEYHTVEVEYVDTEIFKSVSYEIVGDKIVFTVVTLAGDYNRIKVVNANAVGTSLGVGTYTVDDNGNYVWTVKTDAPKETTTFAFDLRTTANKYLKDYYEFKVEIKEAPVIFKSTSYEIVDGKVIFTAVTKAGDYNRVKIALLSNIGSYVKYVDTYTVNADGDYVWTLKFNAPTAVTEYALDIRVASTMRYVKDYYYVSVDPTTAEPETVFVSGSGVIADGKLTLTIVTLPTTVNRVKVMLTSDQSTYVKLIDKYTVDANGNYVWTATVAAPSETTSYTCDVRSSETGRYMKDYFTFEVAVAEEKVDIFKSVSYEIVDGKIVFTVVTTAGNYNRIKVTIADNLGGSLGVGSSYTVNANGDFVWTVKTTAPTESTTYAFDLRTSEMKYLKDYFYYDVTI